MSVLDPQPLQANEVEQAVAFIAAQQVQVDRSISYVGTEAAGIAAELDGLDPSWISTARVLRQGGDITGVVVAEWEVELGRSWINGPWVQGDDPAWTEAANVLLDAALDLLPPEVTRHEMSGDVANQRLTALAASRGWHTSEANHVLVADAAVVAGWPAADESGLRPARADDVDAIRPLHDAEFPDTYASAAQLVEGQLDGSRLVLVAEDGDGGKVVGYAAGEVHDDGEGFIDFLVVDPTIHRSGVGGRLLRALARRLLDRSSMGRVALTVQDRRAPARTLYEHLGFRPEGVLVGHRSWAS